MLINLLRDHPHDGLAVAWDRPEPTFRHERVVTYKANRSEAPDILRQQMGLVRQVIDTLEIPTLALVVLLGLGHIVARTLGWTRLAGTLKALPIALLAAVALRGDGDGDASYRTLVGAALVASMAGDLFLLSPRGFVPGLVSFLIGHLLYIAAFLPAANVDGAGLALLVPFVGFAALVLRSLWPHLGRLRAPVGGYVAVITTMG